MSLNYFFLNFRDDETILIILIYFLWFDENFFSNIDAIFVFQISLP
jgi:hypothetical protein